MKVTKTPEELAEAIEKAKRRQLAKEEREICVGELTELLVVIEQETWEFKPQKRAVQAGIKLAVRELLGQKRPRE